MTLKVLIPPDECEVCFGCGHICTRCEEPINSCLCEYRFGLDTEEMTTCEACGGSGVELASFKLSKLPN